MAKYAQLPDGTQLEFPDDTSQEVIDRVVKQHLQTGRPTTRMNPLGAASYGFGQGASFGFSDEAAAALAATVKSPFSDKTWRQIYDEQVELERQHLGGSRAYHPYVTGTSELAGGVAAGMKIPAGAPASTVAGAAGRGALGGAAAGGLYGVGTGETPEQRIKQGLIGAGTGAAIGGAVGGISGSLAARRAPPAPTADELATQSQAAYRAVKEAGVVLKPEKVSGLVNGIKSALREEGYRARMHPRVAEALSSFDDAIKEGGQYFSFSELEIQRRILRNAAASLQPDERRVAQLAIEKVDDFISKMNADDVLEGAASPEQASALIRSARQLWSRSSKGEVIDELIERAKIAAPNFSGSGYENALRTQFRQLALNRQKMRTFTLAEQEAIKRVAQGGPLENLLRMIGKAAPTGIVSGSLSSGAGYVLGGPAGAVALPVGAGISREAAKRATLQNARVASELMRRGSPQMLAPSRLADALGIGLSQQAVMDEKERKRLADVLLAR